MTSTEDAGVIVFTDEMNEDLLYVTDNVWRAIL